MATFREANQVRSELKMKLSNYYWYNGSAVLYTNDDYNVVVHTKKIDNDVRRIVAPLINGVLVRTEVDRSA